MEIKKAEEKLGLEFPLEYKQFLEIFGGLPVLELGDYGSMISELRSLRKNYKEESPSNIIPIDEDGYGNYYCLVCSGEDKGKVIFWQHDLPPEKTYPNIPAGKDKDFLIESPDFGHGL